MAMLRWNHRTGYFWDHLGWDKSHESTWLFYAPAVLVYMITDRYVEQKDKNTLVPYHATQLITRHRSVKTSSTK